MNSNQFLLLVAFFMAVCLNGTKGTVEGVWKMKVEFNKKTFWLGLTCLLAIILLGWLIMFK